MRAKARGVGRFHRVATTTLIAWLLLVGCKRDQAEKLGQDQVKAAIHSSVTAVEKPRLSQLYHLSEGSEFVPYCALELFAREQGKDVDAYFQSYHLIPDTQSAANPLGLPVGVTVSEGPIKLVGFNCAACHVGQIPGAPSLIVGGPSNFDIRHFYDELIPWLSDLKKHPKLVRRVVGCMLLGSKGESSKQPAAEEVTQELAVSLEPSADESKVDSDLYTHLDEASAPASPDAARELERAAASAGPHSKTLQALPKREQLDLLKALVADFVLQKKLLNARIKALETVRAVGALEPTTEPGPGRVDAFMTALNLMNPTAKLPMNSPVSFPHLWGVAHLTWRHWDNNTNASLQRNMGQAIGVGAVTVEVGKDLATSIASTLNVPGLITFEESIPLIEPPSWPFTRSDASLVAAGQKLYQGNCARCHEPAQDGSLPDLLSENPGTDRQRLENFAGGQAGAKPIDLLRTQLAAVERGSSASASQRDPNPVWRTTDQYGVRSLRGVWATAPYLHNNSVPTLADLLTQPADRPKKFTLDYSRYDPERVGFPVVAPAVKGKKSFELDTAVAGNGNGGHEYGTGLNAGEKASLLAYLKQL